MGWALEGTLASRLPLVALEQATAERESPPGLALGLQGVIEERLNQFKIPKLITFLIILERATRIELATFSLGL